MHSALLAARSVDAYNRCRSPAWKDATPGGAGKFNRLNRTAAGQVFSAVHAVDRFPIWRRNTRNAAPLRLRINLVASRGKDLDLRSWFLAVATPKTTNVKPITYNVEPQTVQSGVNQKINVLGENVRNIFDDATPKKIH